MSDCPDMMRKRGRPATGRKGIRVSTYLPVETFDRLAKVASRRREHVSAVVRNLVVLRLPAISDPK